MLEGTPLLLYDHLDRFVVEGVAAELMGGLPAADWETLLHVDFETGGLGPLQPFAGESVPAAAAARRVALVSGARAHAGGKSVELVGGGAHPLSLRTPAMAVSPRSVYELRYRVASQDVPPARGAAQARASVLLFRREKGAGPGTPLAEPADFAVADNVGTQPWREERVRFHTGPRATHAVVSLDLGRAAGGGAPHRALGRVRFDDVVLRARREPVHLRDPTVDAGMGDPHPLKRSVELDHPAHPDASERRYAIAAPAPSALHFAARVPEEGVLALGYGLLPGARVPGAPPVTFAVEVRGADGAPETLHRAELDPVRARGWRDVEIDLSRHAGRAVRVTLRTLGRPRPSDRELAASRLPEAGCVFSHPVLGSRARAGRLLVLVAVDTLPAARTSTYGYARDTTPELSRIAAQGVRFERALSPSPWTLPALASIFTGHPPTRHRAGEIVEEGRSWRRPLADAHTTAAERLRAGGFETFAWINNPNLTRRLGVHQGFAHFVDYGTRNEPGAAGPALREIERVLASPRGTDRLVFVHLMDPHGPYAPPEPWAARFAGDGYRGRFEQPPDGPLFAAVTRGEVTLTDADRSRLRALYDAGVAYTDAALGRLFDASLAAGPPEKLVFLVTADHGEEFWEHGAFEHGHSVFDELLRVPLVAVLPGRAPGGRLVDAPVSTADLYATLLELAEVDAAPPPGAHSLAPVLAGAAAPRGRALLSASTLYGVERLALERGGWKYIYNQASELRPGRRAPRPAARHELYDLEADPGETANRFRERSARGLALHEALAEAFVETLGGDFAVALDAGGAAPPVLSGSLALPPGARWSLLARDLVWPLADGSDAELSIERRWAFGTHQVAFRVRAPRAVLGFRIREGPAGPVRVRMALDGRPLPASRIRVGGSQRAPAGTPIEIAPGEDWLAPGDLLEPAGAAAGPRVRVGRVRPTPELAGAEAPELDRALREQLEAMGYLE